MKLQFIGHAAFYFEEEGIKALIDPFISNNPQAKVSVDDFEEITHIFVTHGHGDHIGDTVYLAQKHDALVITNYEIASYLGNLGLRVHPMHIGGRFDFDFGTVKMTPALHGSAIHTESGVIDGGSPGGFLIHIKGKSIYHAGDTGLTMDMKLLALDHIDIAMLPIGGNFTMDIRDAIQAVQFIEAQKIIPMHYNTFDLIQADPEVFKNALPDHQVIILNPDDTIKL